MRTLLVIVVCVGCVVLMAWELLKRYARADVYQKDPSLFTDQQTAERRLRMACLNAPASKAFSGHKATVVNLATRKQERTH